MRCPTIILRYTRGVQVPLNNCYVIAILSSHLFIIILFLKYFGNSIFISLVAMLNFMSHYVAYLFSVLCDCFTNTNGHIIEWSHALKYLAAVSSLAVS